ncbi:hypothetical protein BRADI_4g09136v3 [Brachypodium distachyon]|uniref:Uncharacterized protein n=1 Tax=Brachypodium distachyon TaxID=15368 RepID=A0A0Q3PCY2_BRADI|nr:hypothetical protein BRADI_4g09136v3 [Brachypodium distachyon]
MEKQNCSSNKMETAATKQQQKKVVGVESRPGNCKMDQKGDGRSKRKELRRSASLPVRVASAAREQRARLYIMRRCVSMLVASCWNK